MVKFGQIYFISARQIYVINLKIIISNLIVFEALRYKTSRIPKGGNDEEKHC